MNDTRVSFIVHLWPRMKGIVTLIQARGPEYMLDDAALWPLLVLLRHYCETGHSQWHSALFQEALQDFLSSQ